MTDKQIWGLLDTQDNLWMGSASKGPLTYEDHDWARIAAQAICTRMEWPPTRVRATPMESGPFTKRDEVTPKMTGEEAFEHLENGTRL